jgi:inosine-uridine nucleoside N-ribohydrolase
MMEYIKFKKPADDELVKRLHLPAGKIRMVLDTDTYNEIDDQFAVIYSLLSPEKLDVEAIYAAPFFKTRSTGPRDGMEKSYKEILRVLEIINISGDNFVYKGSTQYLDNIDVPERSPAVLDLIERAMNSPPNDPLYVAAIGAITNIATAIIIEPQIINRIVVVWLGGNALHWPYVNDFNLQQDMFASRLIFDCGVPLIQVPCNGVTTHLRTTVPEMEKYVKPCGKIGEYLFQIFSDYSDDHFGWSKVIWDIAAIAFLINPDWLPSNLIHSPILTNDMTWSFDNSRHFIRIIYTLDRDAIFKDLFSRLAFANNKSA